MPPSSRLAMSCPLHFLDDSRPFLQGFSCDIAPTQIRWRVAWFVVAILLLLSLSMLLLLSLLPALPSAASTCRDYIGDFTRPLFSRSMLTPCLFCLGLIWSGLVWSERPSWRSVVSTQVQKYTTSKLSSGCDWNSKATGERGHTCGLSCIPEPARPRESPLEM